jgi:hypothetical protein
MEKKPNMSNVDELCVKYVFDELDPSEITLVEQAMMHDQNLLIEVESLKSTWRKLKNLPELTPPPNLSDAILDQAKDYSSQQQFFGNSWKNPGLLATAAIVLFSLLISTAYLLPADPETGINTEETTVKASAGAVAPAMLHSEGTYGELFRVWNSHGNIVATGSEKEGLAESGADSLQQQLLMPSAREPNSIIMSPAFREFQLTGSRY